MSLQLPLLRLSKSISPSTGHPLKPSVSSSSVATLLRDGANEGFYNFLSAPSSASETVPESTEPLFRVISSPTQSFSPPFVSELQNDEPPSSSEDVGALLIDRALSPPVQVLEF